MFTRDNTEGFNQKTLDTMNAELQNAIKDLDTESIFYADECQNQEQKIFNRYC